MKRWGEAAKRLFTGPHWKWFALGAVCSFFIALLIDRSVATFLSGMGGWIIGGIIVQYVAIGMEDGRP